MPIYTKNYVSAVVAGFNCFGFFNPWCWNRNSTLNINGKVLAICNNNHVKHHIFLISCSPT